MVESGNKYKGIYITLWADLYNNVFSLQSETALGSCNFL